MLVAAAERGIHRDEIEQRTPAAAREPVRRRPQADVDRARRTACSTSRAPSSCCLPLCASGTAGAAEANTEMAARGLRVLAVAVGAGAEETELRLLGLVGIADPPRTEAIAAVAAARAAGIRPS